ncbi:MAG: iron-containing alcohol dehydrogenase [Clostridia bacterium]|nr:iron-containing alcohol dehydrogenase [Clostridia bacterium]
MQRFTLPRDLYHGKGALEALKSFEGKKAMICVGGGSMKRFGFLQKAEAYLKEAGMEVELFEGIEPDPSVDTVMKGAAAMEKFQPDWIVAIGGGSPIDAAKAMWIKYEYPDITFEDMCKVFGIPKLRKKAHFCAISSTSGTATEVTAFSIITDYQKGIKYPIADFEITPDVAIVDPELAETMPKKLVAHTGMDALTHAIEAYVSTANSDYTDPLALHAIKMIQEDLIGSYNEDMEKRDAMHNAQCLAGMAFSNALLGIVHSMAHKTGAAFADYGAHISHGAANAMYLPTVRAFNAKDPTAKKRYGQIADFMKLGGNTDDEKVELLIRYVRHMNDELNIPHCIKNYGPDSYPTEQGFVPENVFLERLPEIAANAILDACTGSNPRQPSQEEMEKLLKCCYYDTEVDF